MGLKVSQRLKITFIQVNHPIYNGAGKEIMYEKNFKNRKKRKKDFLLHYLLWKRCHVQSAMLSEQQQFLLLARGGNAAL